MENGYSAVSGAVEKGADVPPYDIAVVTGLPVQPADRLIGGRLGGEGMSLLASNVTNHAGTRLNNNREGKGGCDKADNGVFGKGARRTDNDRLVTTLLVLNHMIGSGILNTSQMVLKSGVVVASVFYVIAGECNHCYCCCA